MASRGSSKPAKVSSRWEEILCGIPGYDPFSTAESCWFNEDAAQLAVDFFPECIKHVEGAKAGEPFELEPWEQAITGNLFGWKREDNTRRYRECYAQLSRGNGKSAWGAGTALYGLVGLQEFGAQVYCAAGTRDQAGYIFRPAKAMALNEPAFAEAGVRVLTYSITLEARNSVLKPLTGDADSQHGANIFMAVVDELHIVGWDFWRALRTGLGKRKEPLLICTTTAGWDRNSVCYQRYNYACQVRDNSQDSKVGFADCSFLPVVYETATSDDWKDEAVWHKANPNLDVSVMRDYLRSRCAEAVQLPSEENTFRQLHLGQWTEQAVRLIPMDKWDAIDEPVEEADLLGRDCFGGLDLASTSDIAAFVLVFPYGEAYKVLPFFFVPKDNARQRSTRDHVDYLNWIGQGHIIATDGNEIDYDVIRRTINDLGAKFNIRSIARDRWNATQITHQLAGDGFEIVDFGQGYASMSAPCKELLRLVKNGTLHHGRNPVLRWMASNAAGETDSVENLKLSKKKSSEKIDGMVGLAMAIGLAIHSDGSSENWYTPGILRN